MNRVILAELIVGGSVGVGSLGYLLVRYRKLTPQTKANCLCLAAITFAYAAHGIIGFWALAIDAVAIVIWVYTVSYYNKRNQWLKQADANNINTPEAAGKEKKLD